MSSCRMFYCPRAIAVPNRLCSSFLMALWLLACWEILAVASFSGSTWVSKRARTSLNGEGHGLSITQDWLVFRTQKHR